MRAAARKTPKTATVSVKNRKPLFFFASLKGEGLSRGASLSSLARCRSDAIVKSVNDAPDPICRSRGWWRFPEDFAMLRSPARASGLAVGSTAAWEGIGAASTRPADGAGTCVRTSAAPGEGSASAARTVAQGDTVVGSRSCLCWSRKATRLAARRCSKGMCCRRVRAVGTEAASSGSNVCCC